MSEWLFEKLRAYVTGVMNDGADQYAIRFPALENDMRLKAEPTKARPHVISALTYAREVREQTEDAFKPGQIRVGLIAAELCFAVIVEDNKLGLGLRAGS